MSRNLVVYPIVYVVYFMAKASLLLVVNVTHTGLCQFGNVVLTSSTRACFAAADDVNVGWLSKIILMDLVISLAAN